MTSVPNTQPLECNSTYYHESAESSLGFTSDSSKEEYEDSDTEMVLSLDEPPQRLKVYGKPLKSKPPSQSSTFYTKRIKSTLVPLTPRSLKRSIEQRNAPPIMNHNSQHANQKQNIKQEIKQQITQEIKQQQIKQEIEQQQMNHNIKQQQMTQIIEQSHIGRRIFCGKNKYVIVKRIGCGASCKVYKVVQHETGDSFAIKEIPLQYGNHNKLKEYQNEINLLQQLTNEPKIIRMLEYEISIKQKKIVIVLELGGIDLAHILSREVEPNVGCLSKLFQIRFYWHQMLKCIEVIHKYRIVHGDLKPANFVLVAGILKLIDFGISGQIVTNDTIHFKRDIAMGTLAYISPEGLFERSNIPRYKLGVAADIWSLGCLLHKICFACTPFSHLNRDGITIAVVTESFSISSHKKCADISEIIGMCLKVQPDERCQLSELLNHQFLQN